jgi:hypothetical protein
MKTVSEAVSLLKFECERCGQHIAAPASAAGQMVECPECHQKFPVPTEAEIAARGENWRETKAAWKPEEKAPPAKAPVELPATPPERPRDDLLRARAETLSSISTFFFSVGALLAFFGILLLGSEAFGLYVIEAGGGVFGLGLWVSVIAQLMHLRAGVERIANRK